jgi:hypothetical protein
VRHNDTSRCASGIFFSIMYMFFVTDVFLVSSLPDVDDNNNGPTLATNTSRWAFFFLPHNPGPTLATNAGRWAFFIIIT